MYFVLHYQLLKLLYFISSILRTFIANFNEQIIKQYTKSNRIGTRINENDLFLHKSIVHFGVSFAVCIKVKIQ